MDFWHIFFNAFKQLRSDNFSREFNYAAKGDVTCSSLTYLFRRWCFESRKKMIAFCELFFKELVARIGLGGGWWSWVKRQPWTRWSKVESFERGALFYKRKIPSLSLSLLFSLIFVEVGQQDSMFTSEIGTKTFAAQSPGKADVYQKTTMSLFLVGAFCLRMSVTDKGLVKCYDPKREMSIIFKTIILSPDGGGLYHYLKWHAVSVNQLSKQSTMVRAVVMNDW